MPEAEATSQKKISPQVPQQQLDQVREQFQSLQDSFNSALPKVDKALLTDFLGREKSTDRPLSYTIEVFTRDGVDPESARGYIISKTGMAPAIFDNGTHYVTNQILTLGMLKEINDSEDVLEVRGSYCGGIGQRAAHFERAPH
jgi:hypothetical protein